MQNYVELGFSISWFTDPVQPLIHKMQGDSVPADYQTWVILLAIGILVGAIASYLFLAAINSQDTKLRKRSRKPGSLNAAGSDLRSDFSQLRR
jgi:hypothetical protein